MRFSLHWTEVCNLEVEAVDVEKAVEIWKTGKYNPAKVVRELLDFDDIEEIKKQNQNEKSA